MCVKINAVYNIIDAYLYVSYRFLDRKNFKKQKLEYFLKLSCTIKIITIMYLYQIPSTTNNVLHEIGVQVDMHNHFF